jgi:DNA-binding HxlR family transcriptional regulator
MHEKRFGELMRQSVDEITNLKLANRTLELERDRLITDREKYL